MRRVADASAPLMPLAAADFSPADFHFIFAAMPSPFTDIAVRRITMPLPGCLHGLIADTAAFDTPRH